MIHIKITIKSRGSLIVTATGYGLVALVLIMLLAVATTWLCLYR